MRFLISENKLSKVVSKYLDMEYKKMKYRPINRTSNSGDTILKGYQLISPTPLEKPLVFVTLENISGKIFCSASYDPDFFFDIKSFFGLSNKHMGDLIKDWLSEKFKMPVTLWAIYSEGIYSWQL